MTISFEKVGLVFGDKPPLFDQVDLAISSGEYWLIQGPSGSGKSSLLKLMNRLIEPTRGRLFVDDRPLVELPVLEHRRRVAYLQQLPVMLDGTVRDNLLLPFRYGIARNEETPSDSVLGSHLEHFLLQGIGLHDEAAKLSVGQQQRLALIRLLLTHPQMLLCDEPTSALDPDSRSIVEKLLEEMVVDEGMGVAMVTHLDVAFSRLRPRLIRVEPELGLKEVLA